MYTSITSSPLVQDLLLQDVPRIVSAASDTIHRLYLGRRPFEPLTLSAAELTACHGEQQPCRGSCCYFWMIAMLRLLLGRGTCFSKASARIGVVWLRPPWIAEDFGLPLWSCNVKPDMLSSILARRILIEYDVTRQQCEFVLLLFVRLSIGACFVTVRRVQAFCYTATAKILIHYGILSICL